MHLGFAASVAKFHKKAASQSDFLAVHAFEEHENKSVIVRDANELDSHHHSCLDDSN
jgi:hypothetical protein